MTIKNYSSINSSLFFGEEMKKEDGNGFVFAPAINANQEEDTPKKTNLKPFLVLVVVIVLIVGIIGGILIRYRQEKDIISQKSFAQILKLQELEMGYKQTIVMIQGEMRTTEVNNTNQVLGAFTMAANQKEGKVLGLENEPEVKFIRKYISILNNNLNRIENIETNNQKFEKELQKAHILNFFNSNHSPPLKQSQDFVSSSEATLNYIKESQNISIELIISAMDFATGIGEAVLRGADEASIKRLEQKLDDIRDIETKIENANISGLSTQMKTNHQKEVDMFNNYVDILVEVYNALKNKNLELLEKALISLKSVSISSEKNMTEQISFWRGDDALGAVEQNKKLWINYRNEL
jgi:uncharacterized protein YneF (UPF0154 family)